MNADTKYPCSCELCQPVWDFDGRGNQLIPQKTQDEPVKKEAETTVPAPLKPALVIG